MQARIQRWGNCLALRIPKTFAIELGLASDAPVELTLVGGKLVIEPTAAPEYTSAKSTLAIWRAISRTLTPLTGPQF